MYQQKRTCIIWQWICTGAVACFFLLAAANGLYTDLTSGHFASMFTRLGIILGASLLVGLRAGWLLAQEQNRHPAALALICLFCGIVFYPTLAHVSFLGRSSVQVARYLERVRQKKHGSVVDIFRAYPGCYEKYWQDNSILPKTLIYLNAMVKVYLLKVSPNPTVALGKNGFYFEGYGARKVEKGVVESFDNIADYLGQIPFSDLELWKWKQTLEERSHWLKQRGVDYVFVLAPTKGLVYPEYLPSTLQALDSGTRRYQQLSHYLRENVAIHFVDLLPSLLRAKNERSYPLLFYKTDFHWNFYGSLVAYQTIVRHMQDFFPQYPLKSLSLNDFEIKVDRHWAHHRFMNMIGLPERLHRHEHYLTLVPKPGSPLYGVGDLPPEGVHDVYPPKRSLTNSRGETMAIRMVRNPRAPLDSILLLGDSFMEKCVYYFSANARKVWNYRTVVNFPYKIFSYTRPTIAIQEILNMFILRPPPLNPSGIRQEYLASCFAAAGPEGEALQWNRGRHGRIRVKLPPAAGTNRPELLVRIYLETDRDGTVMVYLDTGGKEVPWYEERVIAGRASLYVSVPPGGRVQDLVLAPGQGAQTSTRVERVRTKNGRTGRI